MKFAMLKDFAKISAAAALVLSLTVNVNAQYRKSWDFTKWSQATIANMKATDDLTKNPQEREWSSQESNSKTDDLSDKTYWLWQDAGSTTEPKSVTANGTVISELDGLWYLQNGSIGSLAISIDRQEISGMGTYQGPQYLWLGGKQKNYFVIPHVAIGETIEMGVESHKSSEARGVELYIAKKSETSICDRGTKLMDPDGNAVAVPKTYTIQTWRVPTDVAESDNVNEDGTVNLVIYNTNGCHLYYITVGDGDGPGIVEAKKVAYVTNDEAGALDDARLALEGASDQVELTVIQSTATDVTLDSLQQFEAVVVSPYVGVGDAMVAVLKSAIAYQPMLNLNAALYSTWALGEVAQSETPTLTVPEAAAENALFAGIDLSEGLMLQVDGTAPYVTLGNYFADDAVLAYAGEGQVAIHQHNADRNSYIFVPVTDAVMNVEVLNSLVINGVVAVADTKKKVTPCSAPAIKLTYGDKVTNVAISAIKGATVYYTLDGTEPTVESKVYTEPFDLTENTTVKAIAELDGYLLSSVASSDVAVKSKAATPSITVAQETGISTVSIACVTEGVKIYYTFYDNGSLSPSTTALYSEPIELTGEPTVIYAFAAGDNVITSDVASAEVEILGLDAQTIRTDTVSHFSASEAAWLPAEPAEGSSGNAKAFYYWGKNSWSYYNTEEIIGYKDVVEKDENGDSIVKQEPIYAANPEAIRIQGANEGNGMENDWQLFSQGQVLTGELQSNPSAIVGNGASGYYYEAATDLIGGPATKGMLTFGGKASGEPYTAAIESNVQFATPFDVIVYIGNGNGSSAATMELQISADGKEWTKVDNLTLASTQRYVKKNRISVNEGGNVYVRVAQVGGGSKAQVYDVYVLNNGEVSQKYQGGTTGIIDVAAAAAEVKSVEVYTLNGMRVAEPVKGINIIRTVYADGKVKVQKVAVR